MIPPKPQRRSLRQAASVVFALSAVLPLLMFTYTLYRLNGIREIQDQITLGLALVAALLGFHILRVIVTRLSGLVRDVGNVAEQGEVRALVVDKDLQVPGIGTIQELQDIAETVDHLWAVWKAEAEPYLGRRVLVSVRNSPRPITGTLVQVTDDGVLLEEEGSLVGVSYRRVSAIQAD